MKKVCLLGVVDKRSIAYPLIKLLSLSGKLLVVTDDISFMRFSDTGGSEFTIGNTDFVVVRGVDEYSGDTSVYDYGLFITLNKVLPDYNKVVYCHGLNKSMLPVDSLAPLDVVGYEDLLITPNKTKLFKMDITKEVMMYVWLCEELQEFNLVYRNSMLVRVMHKFFGDFLGVKIDVVAKLLERK